VVLNLLAGELALLRVENLAAALYDLTFALAAAALAATGRGQIYATLGKGGQQGTPLRYGECVLVIDGNADIAAGGEIFLRYE
jgi:hypothetical protein